MPSREIAFLVRGPDGRCATIHARTVAGALKRYLVAHPRIAGDVSVKPRNQTVDWIDYRVTRE